MGREIEAETGAGVGLKGCGGASEAAKEARAVAVLEQGHAGRRLADRVQRARSGALVVWRNETGLMVIA